MTSCPRRRRFLPHLRPPAPSPSRSLLSQAGRPRSCTSLGARAAAPLARTVDPPIVQQEDCSVHGVAVRDRLGFHELGGPPLFGGVRYLTNRIGMFADNTLLPFLNSDERLRAFLRFREQVFRMAATELVSLFNSPGDLLLFTEDDREQFQSYAYYHIMMCHERRHHPITAYESSNESGVGNISPNCYLFDEHIQSYKQNKKELMLKSHEVWNFFAYRKGLLKLDFIQPNSDPEVVLALIKSTTRWSVLEDCELRRGLESHMNLLKECEMHEGSSMSKVQNRPNSLTVWQDAALEKINLELSSALDRCQLNHCLRFMHQSYTRKKLRSLARECAIQAQSTGFILAQEALHVHSVEQISVNPEGRQLPLVKETVKRTLKGCIASVHRINEQIRRSASRGKAWQLGPLVAFSSIATIAATSLKKHKG